MKESMELKNELFKIDGKGYKAYKALEGRYDFKKYVLSIDHVQGDPFASPSRVRVIIDNKVAQIPEELFDNKNKEIAVCDFLTRLFSKNIRNQSEKIFGSGKSGLIEISRCPQEILERTAIIRNKSFFEARFYVGFPARGRSVLARELEKIIFNIIPNIVESTFIYENIDKLALINRVKLMEDQCFIRENLKEKGLVAFVANGSILPRESGISARPLRDGKKFVSPQALEVEFDTPNRGKIKGMGIPKGITLIVGGGYHGKSTLLKALELGIYNHIEGDGREFVITDESALKVRAEDGRAITSTDISLFINNLPNGKDTVKFNTENASGSTSQAANIIEAIEGKSKVLLIDEDTSATNFMIRDDVMQSLVAREKEPITPFIEIVRALYEQKGISTIIVVGSSGDYFDIADTVIQMDSYIPYDVTEKAKSLATSKILKRINERNININIDFNRILKKGSIKKGPKGIKTKTLGIDGLSINKENIDLRAVEQIVDSEQINTIAEIMKYMEDNVVNNKRTIVEVTNIIMDIINKKGLLSIAQIKGGTGAMAMPRKQEVMAAVNRFRNLGVY